MDAVERDRLIANDPLSTGLPGLPTKVDGVTVSEAGFQYTPADASLPPLDLAWRDISAIRRHAGDIHVERLNGDGEGVYVIREREDAPESRRLIEAWTEYATRKAEADGVLSGSAVLPAAEQEDSPVSRPQRTGPLDQAFLFGLIALGALVLSVLRDFGIELNEGILRIATMLVAGAVVLVQFLGGSEETRRLRWELGPSGLVLTVGDHSRAFAPGEGDTVSPSAAVIDGVRLPLGTFTTYPVVAQIVLALGEREGATILPDRGRCRRAFTVGLAGLVVVLLFGSALPRWGATAAALLVVGIAFLAAEHVRAGAVAQLRRDLETGRRVLERLGW